MFSGLIQIGELALFGMFENEIASIRTAVRYLGTFLLHSDTIRVGYSLYHSSILIITIIITKGVSGANPPKCSDLPTPPPQDIKY